MSHEDDDAVYSFTYVHRGNEYSAVFPIPRSWATTYDRWLANDGGTDMIEDLFDMFHKAMDIAISNIKRVS